MAELVPQNTAINLLHPFPQLEHVRSQLMLEPFLLLVELIEIPVMVQCLVVIVVPFAGHLFLKVRATLSHLQPVAIVATTFLELMHHLLLSFRLGSSLLGLPLTHPEILLLLKVQLDFSFPQCLQQMFVLFLKVVPQYPFLFQLELQQSLITPWLSFRCFLCLQSHGLVCSRVGLDHCPDLRRLHILHAQLLLFSSLHGVKGRFFGVGRLHLISVSCLVVKRGHRLELVLGLVGV